MTIRYGVNNAAKMVCRTHQQAYPQGEQCPWCPAQVTQHFSYHHVSQVSYVGVDPNCYTCGGTGVHATSAFSVTCSCVYTQPVGFP